MGETAASLMPGPGDVLDGKYRLDAYIGSGAMGSVYRATHLALGHKVAIKLLMATRDDEASRARFIREARATMTLRSEHVVRVHDLGFLPAGMPYMVLELLEGIDLRSLIKTEGALAPEVATEYVLQVCEALGEAHLHGIVHRDLKPQNLFLLRRNGAALIKLLDFGVSKVEETHDVELTSSQLMLGSPAFMPPEQIRSSSKVDARADIWSLGVVLYMLLGGGRPFAGDGLTSLCASIMVDPPQPLAARVPAVSFELERVVFRCLEKSRDQRYPNVAEVATALEPFTTAAGRASAERVRQMFAAAPPISTSPSAVPVEIDVEAVVDITGACTAADSRAEGNTESTARPPLTASRLRRWAVGAGGVALFAAAGVVWPQPPGLRLMSSPPLERMPAAVQPLPASPPPELMPEPAPALSASAATRVSTPARPALRKPSTNPSRPSKRPVDRNGVPILD